jgi:hypothetical protein
MNPWNWAKGFDEEPWGHQSELYKHYRVEKDAPMMTPAYMAKHWLVVGMNGIWQFAHHRLIAALTREHDGREQPAGLITTSNYKICLSCKL